MLPTSLAIGMRFLPATSVTIRPAGEFLPAGHPKINPNPAASSCDHSLFSRAGILSRSPTSTYHFGWVPAYNTACEAGTCRELPKPGDGEQSGARILALRIDLHCREVSGVVAEHSPRAVSPAEQKRASGMSRIFNCGGMEYPFPASPVGASPGQVLPVERLPNAAMAATQAVTAGDRTE